ncbi:MAG: dihydroneopterin aldolase [Bacteroidales bacterium]|nr:dihydroneopterin aldolase [Bacteroidales bacterium]
MKGKIELTGMKFHSRIGCLDSEKELGNEMTVDFSCDYDISKAALSDALEDTLDYSDIYGIVSEQMEAECNLLENAAGRIVSAIRKAHPELEHFSVKVSKKNPPVDGQAEWSAVSLEI